MKELMKYLILIMAISVATIAQEYPYPLYTATDYETKYLVRGAAYSLALNAAAYTITKYALPKSMSEYQKSGTAAFTSLILSYGALVTYEQLNRNNMTNIKGQTEYGEFFTFTSIGIFAGQMLYREFKRLHEHKKPSQSTPDRRILCDTSRTKVYHDQGSDRQSSGFIQAGCQDQDNREATGTLTTDHIPQPCP